MRSQRGFTLLELMIVVAIIAILALFAYNSYTNQIRKSRRSEARQALSDLALRQEKYRSDHATYATCDQAFSPSSCSSFNSTLTYYTIAVTAGSISGTGFTATATPKGDQVKDSCGTLTFKMNATIVEKTPDGCW